MHEPEVGPSQEPDLSRTVVLAACFTLSIICGSFYCWSMLLPSMEALLACSRATLSAVFSLATVCFTAGTFLGPLLIRRLSPSALILTIAAVTGSGLLMASLLGHVSARAGLVLLAIGWAGGFGTMSGLAYLCNAKISNSRLFQGNNGLATGLLVSGRALGAPLATVQRPHDNTQRPRSIG